MENILLPIGVATVLTPPLLYGAHKFDQRFSSWLKRRFPDSEWAQPYPSKKRKIEPVSGSPKVSNPFIAMPAIRRRGRFRRRRRVIRRRRRVGRRRFSRRVKKVIFRTLEPRVNYLQRAELTTLRETDIAGSRVTYIWRPLSSMLQGIEDDNFTGNKYWIKGFEMRGQMSISTTTVATAGLYVRFSLIRSRAIGQYANIPQEFGSTTLDAVGPVQAPPFTNPRIFQGPPSAQVGSTWVGDGIALPFDSSNIKVLKSMTVYVTGGGTEAANQNGIPVPFKFWMPIHKMFQIQDPVQAEQTTVQSFGKNYEYYIIGQVIDTADTSNTSPDVGVVMLYSMMTYWRDI